MLLRHSWRETDFEQGCRGRVVVAVGTAKEGFQE
jgi:hypothetical protein